MKPMVKSAAILGAFLFAVVSIAAAAETRFTKYNIHAQVKEGAVANASYANYTDPGVGHIIVPAGTQITIDKKSQKRFEFTYDNGSMRVRFDYHSKRMGMDVDEYIALITSAEPVSFADLTQLDQEGMKAGKAGKGMTRAGVLAALGYPAAHKTLSLDAKTWIYWTNRFGTVAVDFDDNGKVSAVRD